MEDLIACLYPYGEPNNGYAHQTVRNSRNSSRLVDAEIELPELQGRNSRESTATLDDSTDTKHTHYSEGLQLTFTHGPKAWPGFVLRTDTSSCDIVLPPLKGISRRHCYLTFDAERRWILRDCSTNGTTVEYNEKGGEKRRHFTWILGGHRVPDKTDSIVIQLHATLRFQIVVAKPTSADIYFESVNDFLEETAATASLPFGTLGIQSVAPTVAPSGADTPNQDPILLEQETRGRGTFAVVTRVWDVSTGQSPPIVHRDIKPENILVQSRDPLHIKLGDFGLSKASETLKTMCGTLTYLPPELARYCRSEPPSRFRYTYAVDVWSFGTVVYQYAYGLPHPGKGSGWHWCKKIVEGLNDWEPDGLIDLLSAIVVMDAYGRLAARVCLERASQLDRSSRSSTPTRAFSTHESNQNPAEIKQLSSVEYPALDREVVRLLAPDKWTSTIVQQDNRKRPAQCSSTSRAQSERRTKKTIVSKSDNSQRHTA